MTSFPYGLDLDTQQLDSCPSVLRFAQLYAQCFGDPTPNERWGFD